jgi:interleukin-1 receptor-associated kinase 1
MCDQHEEIYHEKALIEALSKRASSLHSRNSSPRKFSEAHFVLGIPLELSWEMVEEMTLGFRTWISADDNSDYLAYEGVQPFDGYQVMVKRYSIGELSTVLEKEKKAALSMHHKNILGLTAFYHSKNTTVLVFPSAKRGTLHANIYGNY